MKKVFAFVLVIMAGWFGHASACEFCTLHNGLGQYNNQGDFISLTERYTSASAFVKGGTVVPNNTYAIQINTVQLMYQHAFDEDLKGTLVLPYFGKRSAATDDTGTTFSDTSSGMGDVSALLRYTVWRGQNDNFFAVMGGLKLPTGGRKPADNGFLNTDLVLGSGSLDELVGFVFSQNIRAWSYSLDALYKISNAGYDDYRYGNALNLGVSGYYRVNNNFNAGLGLVSEITAPDTDGSGNVSGTTGTVDNTGGTVFFLSPTVQYTNQNDYIEISYQLPVYRNFIGTSGQTVVDGKFVLAYRHAF
jgi:hypothetical protein